jgi:hypothetical protein
MSEAGWTEVTKLSGSDPRRVVSILRGTHGLFRFDALRWRKYYEPSPADDGPMDGGWWDCEHQSGLHPSAEDAEREARSSIAWLRAAD